MGVEKELAGLDWREQEAVQEAVREGDALEDPRLAAAAVRHGEAGLARLKIVSLAIALLGVAFGVGWGIRTGEWSILSIVLITPAFAFGPLALASNMRRAVKRNRLVLAGAEAVDIESIPRGWGARFADGIMSVYIATVLVSLVLLVVGLLFRLFAVPDVHVSGWVAVPTLATATVVIAVALYRVLSARRLQG